MPTIINSLLADHKMINKILAGFTADNPRFQTLGSTLERVIKAHAGFEDQIITPLANKIPAIQPRLTDEIVREHQDIDFLLSLVRNTPLDKADDLSAATKQLKVILETHFKKEEDAWFPLIEKHASNEDITALIKKHQNVVTPFVRDLIESQ